MGAVNKIPGVSGGTVAFITGIYEDLINNFKESIKKLNDLNDLNELAEEENIIRGKGPYLYTKKDKYFDTTSGLTGTAILGWSNPSINRSIINQLKYVCLKYN